MAKKNTRESSSELPEELIKKAEETLIEKGDIVNSQEESDYKEAIATLKEKIKDTFEFYSSEEFLYVAEDGTAFLEKNISYAHNYGRSTRQKIFKITR
jgi:hypothetical protein